jgi:rhodanese-related sulfurtransferase
MDLAVFQSYGIPSLMAGFLGWRFLKFRRARSRLSRLAEVGAVVVDVRSRGEFAESCNPLSVNIPLDELVRRAEGLDPAKPIVVCCASGGRSARAAAILRGRGFQDVVNAGPWQNTLRVGS